MSVEMGQFLKDRALTSRIFQDNEESALYESIANHITQLQAEVESLRKDAERYQWLCDKGYNYHGAIIGSPSMSIGRGSYILLESPSHNSFSNLVLSKQAADAFIDAAITREAT